MVSSVPDVVGCHNIRTRGTADSGSLDLHIWMDATCRSSERIRYRTSSKIA